MTSAATQPHEASEISLVDRTTRLMGGVRVLGRRISSELQAHAAVEKGLPSGALHHLVEHLSVLDVDTSLEKGVGLSRRTFQRTKDAPRKPLSVEQSGRMWKFAEIVALASDVMGSQELAERWLERPAIGLDSQRPIDLLSTPLGVAAVETLLQRIKYGVYT